MKDIGEKGRYLKSNMQYTEYAEDDENVVVGSNEGY